MGKITRTNYGIHHRTVLTNDEILNLPLQSVVVIHPVPDKIVFQQASSLWLDWHADYTGIDPNAELFMGISNFGITVSPLEENSGVPESIVSKLLAAGASAFLTCSNVGKVSGGNDLLAVGFLAAPAIGAPLELSLNNGGMALGGGHPLNRLVCDLYYHVVEPLP